MYQESREMFLALEAGGVAPLDQAAHQDDDEECPEKPVPTRGCSLLGKLDVVGWRGSLVERRLKSCVVESQIFTHKTDTNNE